MSEGHSEERPGEGATPAEPEAAPPLAANPVGPRTASRRAAVWLAALLVLIVVGVALSPFWAPEVAPLLPWGAGSAVSPEDYSALAARVALIEKRPAPPKINADAIKSAETALGRRVDELEAARNADRQTEAAVAATKGALQQLEHRVGAVEAQSSSRVASAAAELEKMQQELSGVRTATADLAHRLPGIERQVQAQSGAERNNAVLALLLLQMREAVEWARPFPAAYNAFRALDHNSELAAAVEPLAEPARNGVASRAVLSKRLAELAGHVATAIEPPADSDWGAQTLARLRGLVTIRRIDGASQTGPEAAVSAAQAALARGDLVGAVAVLEPLSGANAEAARPWLQMARERLTVERALDHLQELLTARLGSGPAGPAAAPGGAPAEPSAAKSPS